MVTPKNVTPSIIPSNFSKVLEKLLIYRKIHYLILQSLDFVTNDYIYSVSERSLSVFSEINQKYNL